MALSSRAEPGEFAETVDEIATQLRTDPVLVEDIMGNGHTAEVKQALDTKADEADVPVYVVLTETPRGLGSEHPDEELASLLHARLGEDGVYYVATSEGHGSLGIWGDLDPSEDDDATHFEAAKADALTQVREAIEQPESSEGEVMPAKVAEAAVTLELAADQPLPDSDQVLTEDQVDLYTTQTWLEHPVNVEKIEPPGIATSTAIATAVGITVAVVVYRLLRAWAAPRSTDRVARPQGTGSREASQPSLTSVRARIDRSVALIDERLERSDFPTEHRVLARNSRDTAVRLRNSTDTLDVVGALVLARSGAHALTSGGAERYRCCYINPLHGDAHDEADLGTGLSVPVCRGCRKALAARREPDALLEVRPMARDRPYYVGDTVWARTGFGTLEDDLWSAVEEARR